jgi:hypothetical protein
MGFRGELFSSAPVGSLLNSCMNIQIERLRIVQHVLGITHGGNIVVTRLVNHVFVVFSASVFAMKINCLAQFNSLGQLGMVCAFRTSPY